MGDEPRGYTEDEWRGIVTRNEAEIGGKQQPARCSDCLRPYGDQYGFPDLVIPDWAWQRISPKQNEGGLLCPSCICKRLFDAEIRCEGAFTSGPIRSIDQELMWCRNRIEEIERRLGDAR